MSVLLAPINCWIKTCPWKSRSPRKNSDLPLLPVFIGDIPPNHRHPTRSHSSHQQFSCRFAGLTTDRDPGLTGSSSANIGDRLLFRHEPHIQAEPRSNSATGLFEFPLAAGMWTTIWNEYAGITSGSIQPEMKRGIIWMVCNESLWESLSACLKTIRTYLSSSNFSDIDPFNTIAGDAPNPSKSCIHEMHQDKCIRIMHDSNMLSILLAFPCIHGYLPFPAISSM